MTPEEGFQTIRFEIDTGIALPKCQKCGCMDSALKNLAAVLPSVISDDVSTLVEAISLSLEKMRPIQYTCLGCEHCYPAVAQNAFGMAFPALSLAAADLSCEFRVRDEAWPPVVGEYFVLDKSGSVAISTLATVQLAEEIADRRPSGLAIVGKTETENIGIDKVIKNVITSPTIRYLIVAGIDSKGHFAGKTLLALAENGVDENRRVVGSPAKRPILRNLSIPEIRAFREQVQVIDMIGCESPDDIGRRVEELSREAADPCGCSECGAKPPVSISTAPRVTAAKSGGVVKLDQGGYFVIIPQAETGVISVEHYAYDNSLLRVIEGTTARALYNTIIDNRWVTELSHAAYLGKELTRAELSFQLGFKFVQDGA
jgi:tetrahydromethanopterin S-methyltransferase subunit A